MMLENMPSSFVFPDVATAIVMESLRSRMESLSVAEGVSAERSSDLTVDAEAEGEDTLTLSAT